MMGAVCRRAAQVIVWLGKAPSSLASAFDYIERLKVARLEAFDGIHDESGIWQESVRMILRMDRARSSSGGQGSNQKWIK